MNKPSKITIKTYSGSEESAINFFRLDAAKMAEKDYYPVSQAYTQGSYSGLQFLLALALCLIGIGVFILIYMVIVKPSGRLTVTYEHRPEVINDDKTCPMCAEKVKLDAKVCRFCGHKFE